ncbi:hypothetical protein ACPV5U_19095 [Vibrio mediterranei]
MDTSKLSNKDDLIVLIVFVVALLMLALVTYLVLTEKTFLAGFSVATLIWKWHEWLYKPVDVFLEKHWPFKGNE